MSAATSAHIGHAAHSGIASVLQRPNKTPRLKSQEVYLCVKLENRFYNVYGNVNDALESGKIPRSSLKWRCAPESTTGPRDAGSCTQQTGAPVPARLKLNS